MIAFLTSWVFWLVVALVLAGLGFMLGSRTAERGASDERDELIGFYDSREKIKAKLEQVELDRWKRLLDDVAAKAEDNMRLVKDFEDKWQGQPAEHHRGKAAAYRDILIRYGFDTVENKQ